MTGFGALVLLGVRDLMRRRMLWVIVLVLAAMVAMNYFLVRSIEEAVGEGVSYDVATRRAASQLGTLVESIRGYSVLAVALLAPLLAPEARRNGTAQFVLSLGVGRGVYGASQFVALAGLVTAAVLALHVGYVVVAYNVDAPLGTAEAALSWLSLLLPLLTVAAAFFAFSLAFSTIETYLALLAAPIVLKTMLGFDAPWRRVPSIFVRLVENVTLLFPDPQELIAWPRLDLQGAPASSSSWTAAHVILASAFWVGWGLWSLWHHDFGSRSAVK